jgi:hypothetical protein
MAAKSAWVTCAKGTFVQLTDNAGATGDVSVVLVGGHMAWLIPATSTTPPTTIDDGLPVYTHGDGWSEATIPEKFPDDATNTHLFAFSPQGATIAIHHG